MKTFYGVSDEVRNQGFVYQGSPLNTTQHNTTPQHNTIEHNAAQHRMLFTLRNELHHTTILSFSSISQLSQNINRPKLINFLYLILRGFTLFPPPKISKRKNKKTNFVVVTLIISLLFNHFL